MSSSKDELKKIQGFEEDLDSSSDSDSSDGADAPDGMLDLGKANVDAGVSTDDDDSDDSDSEGDDVEMEIDFAEAEEKLVGVNTQLESNPFGYDLLVEKIRLLRATGELEKLRNVREKLNEYYPLSPQLWMDWIRDETKVAETEEEKEELIKLFERAVADYLSVELWLEYAKFSMNFMGKENGVQKCRDVFERALAVGGLHVSLGSLLWYAYRDFEAAVLGLPMSEAETAAQENRYITLCRRQVSVPLLGMEQSYAEICEKIEVDDATTDAYSNALKKLRAVEEYEKQLIDPSIEEAGKANVYRAYIALEIKEKSNPARIQCLYERAVADCPLDSSMWLEYTEYLTSSLKIPDLIVKTCERATRNCPWIIDLWIEYMRAAEKYENMKLVGIFEKAILNFQTHDDVGRLWLKYLECLRRLLKTKDYPEEEMSKFAANVQAAEQHILQVAAEAEPNTYVFQIRMMLLRLQASRAKTTNGIREAWKELLDKGYGTSFRNWLQYLMLELQFGNTNSQRRELGRAVAYVKDDLYSAADMWLNFERDSGDASHLVICEKKIAKYMQEVPQEHVDSYSPLNNNTNSFNKKKRKLNDEVDSVPGKKSRGDSNSGNQSKSKGLDVVDREGFKVPLPAKGLGNKNDKRREQAGSSKDSATPAVPEKFVHDSSKDDRTVFVSNLAFATDENAIRDFFKDIGNIAELRLVRDFKGRSKGYAYVIFDLRQSVDAALKQDRVGLGGRPVFVSKCDPNKSTRPSGFKFAVKLEKQKLFLKGLPASYGKPELEKIFAPFGQILDIRVVTFRNGHSKGMAYLEYQDEFSAARAIKETDGKDFDGHTISVAISNPPPKRDAPGSVPADMRLFQRRAPTAFVPRSLQVSKNRDDPSSSGKPMTNADFKELLKLKRPTPVPVPE